MALKNYYELSVTGNKEKEIKIMIISSKITSLSETSPR